MPKMSIWGSLPGNTDNLAAVGAVGVGHDAPCWWRDDPIGDIAVVPSQLIN